MNVATQNKLQAKIHRMPLWAQIFVLPFYFTAVAWKMQAVFTLIGVLWFFKDYAAYRGGNAPHFNWSHALLEAIIPIVIIPIISVVFAIIFVYRAWAARKRGNPQ